MKNDNRIEYILTNIMNDKIKIEDLAINDILTVSKYLNAYDKKLDKDFYLKNYDLSLLLKELENLG